MAARPTERKSNKDSTQTERRRASWRTSLSRSDTERSARVERGEFRAEPSRKQRFRCADGGARARSLTNRALHVQKRRRGDGNEITENQGHAGDGRELSRHRGHDRLCGDFREMG